MEIRSVIQERRKLLGLTQEQVAEYLGVTTPAVNKWEKGSTCPDIALLPPLARLLRIDLNTLFGFYEDITQQELVHFCQEIREAVLTQGFDAGFGLSQEKLHEYPNSDRLLHTLALLLQGLLITAGLNASQAEMYMQSIDTWYARLTQSSDSTIRNNALFMLASRAITDKHYEKAQAYLDQLSNRNDLPDKRMLQATIYLHQKQAEEAVKLMETALLTAVNDAQLIMSRLIDANIAAGDNAAAAYAAERFSQFAQLFDLPPYSALVALFQIAVANKDAQQTIALLKEMLHALSTEQKIEASPLYHRLSTSSAGASMESMILPLLNDLEQNPEYAYLHTNEEFQSLLTEFKDR